MGSVTTSNPVIVGDEELNNRVRREDRSEEKIGQRKIGVRI